jgi:hypothetical protein
MFPQKLVAYVEWLEKQVMPGHIKVQMLKWWARWVGIQPQGRWYARVERSGA